VPPAGSAPGASAATQPALRRARPPLQHRCDLWTVITRPAARSPSGSRSYRAASLGSHHGSTDFHPGDRTTSFVNLSQLASFSIQQGFTTGTTVTLGFVNQGVKSNSLRAEINPSNSGSFT